METVGPFVGQVRKSIESSIAVKQQLLDDSHLIATVGKVSEILIDSLRAGNKLILMGNGGSAADAQHIAAEFVGRFAFDRPALPALALSVNTSCVTAIGNDYGFDSYSPGRLKPWAVVVMWPLGFPLAASRRTSFVRCRRRGRWGCRPLG
jgi:D-sedoheptulose 7-phosphate isomerase